MRAETLEQSLLKDLVETLNDKESRAIGFLASGSFDNEIQAREHVGYIRALREAREDFKRIIKAYFPTE